MEGLRLSFQKEKSNDNFKILFEIVLVILSLVVLFYVFCPLQFFVNVAKLLNLTIRGKVDDWGTKGLNNNLDVFPIFRRAGEHFFRLSALATLPSTPIFKSQFLPTT